MLAALEAVKELNTEAGVSNDSLTAIVSAIESDSGRTLFEKFCHHLTATIKSCFIHFQRVRPDLARVRANQIFHQLRLETLPEIWKSFTTGIKLPQLEPLHAQAINHQLFTSSLKEILLQQPQVSEKTSSQKPTLMADEENALRYASGFVAMKLLKTLKKRDDMKSAQFRECLSHMANVGNDSSFYAYTTEWIKSVDRGGLFHVNDTTYILFKAIELKTKEVLPEHLLSRSAKKEDLVTKIVGDADVQQHWCMAAVDIMDEEDADELLKMIVDLWITMRGFAITSLWMEEYKRATAKNVDKSKSLRKELQATSSEA